MSSAVDSGNTETQCTAAFNNSAKVSGAVAELIIVFYKGARSNNLSNLSINDILLLLFRVFHLVHNCAFVTVLYQKSSKERQLSIEYRHSRPFTPIEHERIEAFVNNQSVIVEAHKVPSES